MRREIKEEIDSLFQRIFFFQNKRKGETEEQRKEATNSFGIRSLIHKYPPNKRNKEEKREKRKRRR